MKDRTDREDRLISEMMNDFRMESPSEDFTQKVMRGLETAGRESRISSRPLISTAGWIGIAAGLIILMVLVLSGNGTGSDAEPGFLSEQLNGLNIPALDFSLQSVFSRITPVSPTLIYIFQGIGGLLLIIFLGKIFESFILLRYSEMRQAN